MNLPHFHQQPQFIRATFHINTPMFSAGANQTESELTPTSIKGVMRFWWRALNWSKIRLQPNATKESALKELHEKEAKLFGLASSDNKGGQGDCLVNQVTLSTNKNWQLPSNKSGINYLLGQGLYNFRQGLMRYAFAEKQTFTLDLTVTARTKKAIQDTLQIMGLLGGFGSRSRHGFGSVTLIKLEEKNLASVYQEINFETDIKKSLQQLLTHYGCRKNTELPPLSAFYLGTRIDIIKLGQNSAIEILNTIGEEQQMYRSFGREGKVNGKKAEQNFFDDHEFVINMVKGKPNITAHPKRVVFGLPHNYFYSGNSTRGHSGSVDASTGRRASPLLIHIHQVNNQYQAVHCLLKSEFLPIDTTIDIKAKHDKNQKIIKVSNNVDWQVIETFMNRFNNKEIV